MTSNSQGSENPQPSGPDLESFRFIADTMPQLIWTAKPDGYVHYYNQRWVSYTGLSLDTGQGWGWKDAIHPDDLPACVERWTNSITTHCNYEMELRIKRAADGAYRWHLGRAFPQRNATGEIIQWVGTLTDIEEQKQRRTELEAGIAKRTADLAEANRQLQSVLDGATNVTIIATGREGLITVFNAGAENLLGYKADEMVGKFTPAIIHLESEVIARGLELTQETGHPVEGFEVFVHRARAGLREEREWTYVHKNGSRLTVQLVVSALRDPSGSINGFLAVASDVTSRRQAEAAAAASTQHFRLIVETVQDYALLMLDPGGHVVSWNLGAERIKGYSAGEIIGRHFSCFYSAQDCQRGHPAHELRMAAEQGRYSEEGWRIRKDGSRFWAEVVITSIRDQAGKLLGFAKVVHDITARKQTEERFQLVVEASPSAMIMADADERIAFVNNRAERLFGFSRQDLLGMPISMLIPARFRERHSALVQAFFANPSMRPMAEGKELVVLRSDGTEVPVEIGLNPIQTSEGAFVLASIVDITERKKVEKTLRDQASIIDLANDAIIMRDVEDRIIYWNLGAQRLYGWSKEEALGKVIHKLLRTKFPETLSFIHARLLAQGFWNGELEHIRRDESCFTVASTWTLQRDDANRAATVLEINYDLTARKQAESKLQTISRRLELATGALKAGVWDLEVASGVFQWDARMYEIYGRTDTKPVIYQDWESAIVPQDLPAAEAILQKVISTRSQDFAEFRIQRPDGSVRHVHSAQCALTDDSGEVVRVIGVNLDITERKQAEVAMQEQAIMLDMANDAIFIRDGADRITYWNQGAEKLYGWTAEEAVGQVVQHLLKARFPVPLSGIKAHLLSTGHWSGELTQTAKDGRIINVSATWTVRRNESNQLLSILCINHDITEQKSAAAELLEARRLLEARLRELAATNQELARKNEEVEAFVYIVSHDLRAPLVNMQGFCKELELSCYEIQEILADPGSLNRPVEAARVRAILDEDIPDSLRYIGASTTKFDRLINALLELSRYGRQIYKREKLNLDSMVQATLDVMRLSLATSNVQVSLASVPDVYGDATALGQVWANLIGNAVKYRQPGRPCQIEIGAEALPKEMHCWVRDNGVGLPKSAGQRLFQVFQRFHPNLAEGEGIGLALVRRIVERHGGRIWAEGEEGVGTTFHFTVPRTPEDQEIYA